MFTRFLKKKVIFFSPVPAVYFQGCRFRIENIFQDNETMQNENAKHHQTSMKTTTGVQWFSGFLPAKLLFATVEITKLVNFGGAGVTG